MSLGFNIAFALLVAYTIYVFFFMYRLHSVYREYRYLRKKLNLDYSKKGYANHWTTKFYFFSPASLGERSGNPGLQSLIKHYNHLLSKFWQAVLGYIPVIALCYIIAQFAR